MQMTLLVSLDNFDSWEQNFSCNVWHRASAVKLLSCCKFHLIFTDIIIVRRSPWRIMFPLMSLVMFPRKLYHNISHLRRHIKISENPALAFAYSLLLGRMMYMKKTIYTVLHFMTLNSSVITSAGLLMVFKVYFWVNTCYCLRK